jgi:hypothetical protein
LRQAAALAATCGPELRIVCVIDHFSFDQSWW